MNFDLRKAIIANLDDSNYDEIRETIIDAIESGEEKTLPGLGVMFEILWNGSNDSEKETLVSRITNCLKPKAIAPAEAPIDLQSTTKITGACSSLAISAVELIPLLPPS